MLLPIPPNRGEIYDRNGILIAQNIPVYNLQVMLGSNKNIAEQADDLRKIIDITPSDIKHFKNAKRHHRRYDKVTLKTKLTEDEIAKFYVNQFFYPGVSIETQLIRNYPFKDILVDVLGYVGRINEREQELIDKGEYAGSHYIGKIGIEKFFEDTLHGKVGNQQVEVDAAGRIVRIVKSQEPTPGQDLYLTIDVKLQQVAKLALEGEKGAVVAIDPQTGEVLALASQPAYDPNLFVNGISHSQFAALQSDQNRPLYNRAIRGQYPPASTIKPFMGMVGLESGVVTRRTRIHDPGYYKLDFSSQIFRCWRHSGHGVVDLKRAIINSCDTFFYDLATRMGIDKIASFLQDFGLGNATGIEIGEELSGLIPTPAWKKASRKQMWYPGDTVVTGIGQGYMLTTPLQLAHATATLANRGIRMKPHLLFKQVSPAGVEKINPVIQEPGFSSSDEHWDYIHQSMQRVLSDGTGKRYGQVPYTIAGKTGTAQVANLPKLRALYGKNIPQELRDNTLFIAFAPIDKPRIALAVIVENSHQALTIARKVINFYLMDLKND